MKTPALLLAALLLTTAVPPAGAETPESARLRQLFDLYWTTSLRQRPDFAIAVGRPELAEGGARWADLSPEAIALAHRTTRAQLETLSSIDRSRLTPSEQVDDDLLRRTLEMQIEGERFHDLRFPIDPMGGIDLDLLELMPYLPARTVQDFEVMIARLRGFPKAVDQVLAQLARGLAAGITPPRVTLRAVPGRVASLLADPAGDPWQSPVLEPFKKLPETLPAADRERLRGEAARVYTDQVAPAVRKLHDYLAETYIPGARETLAVSDLPDGKAWYAFLLRTYTTTRLTPGQIHELGLSEVRRIRKEMDALITATGFQGGFDDFIRFLRTDPRFFYEKPEDLVAGYRDIAKRIDPELIRFFGHLPRLPYGVKVLEGDGAKSAPSGYYNNGVPSAGLPGWFLVNAYDLKSRPRWAMEALTLHEAVPGHHLQYAIAQELEDLPEWRKWDVYPAFAEGWALYAEGLGAEMGLYQDPYSNFGRLINEIWRANRLVVDTGIHSMGWTRQQAIDYYKADTAKSEHEIEVEVDRIIVQPGSVPAYKVGELKIRELRSYAERELGPKFDIRAFHDHLLGHGQLPLDLLETSVKAWVATAGQPR
jgi:uncharacterized protein (DUF885 family)